MAMLVLQALDGGLLGAFSQVAVLAGALLLAGGVLAFAAFAYKQLRGGVEWPDDIENDDGDVESGDASDEWKYY
jgi:hypothetical protein